MISQQTFDDLKAKAAAGELTHEQTWEVFEEQYLEGMRHLATVRYAYKALEAFDNYKSGALDGAVREVVTRVRELGDQVTELQRTNSTLLNQRRMWKARAEGASKVVEAITLAWAARFGADDQATTDAWKQIHARIDLLERDAWSNGAAAARLFLEDAKGYLLDYAPDLVCPTDGDDPRAWFIRKWVTRFTHALSEE